MWNLLPIYWMALLLPRDTFTAISSAAADIINTGALQQATTVGNIVNDLGLLIWYIMMVSFSLSLSYSEVRYKKIWVGSVQVSYKHVFFFVLFFFGGGSEQKCFYCLWCGWGGVTNCLCKRFEFLPSWKWHLNLRNVIKVFGLNTYIWEKTHACA